VLLGARVLRVALVPCWLMSLELILGSETRNGMPRVLVRAMMMILGGYRGNRSSAG